MATTTTQTPGLRIRTLCEADAPRWEQYVNAHAEGTFFHTLIWRDAVTQTWGHVTRFLIAERDGRIEGVLPLYLVRSFLAGALLVTDEDVPDRRVVQRVVQRQDRPAGDAEDVGDARGLQGVHQALRPGDLLAHQCCFLES